MQHLLVNSDSRFRRRTVVAAADDYCNRTVKSISREGKTSSCLSLYQLSFPDKELDAVPTLSRNIALNVVRLLCLLHKH